MSGDIMGEIKEQLSVIDSGVGNLSVSTTPYDSSFGETDGSSTGMVKSDVPDADCRLSAFDLISIAKPIKTMECCTTDSFNAGVPDSIGHSEPSGQKHMDGKDTNNLGPTDLVTAVEPSALGAADAVVFAEINNTSNAICPQILRKSSRRHRHSLKVDQNNMSQEKSGERGRMAPKKTTVDLNSLQILRKTRSTFSKRPRSSVWGYLGNAISDSKESASLKKEKKVRKGRGKQNPSKVKIHQESIGKKCPPTGRISLKIKIGNKLCSLGNATENCSSSGKDSTDSVGTVENVFEEKVPGAIPTLHERNVEKVSSYASALSKPRDVKVAFDISSFSPSSDIHNMISSEEGDNLAVSADHICSDVGTSPDSEVINTVPDPTLCGKGLQDIQNSPVISNSCVSPSDTSSLILSPKKSKKGKGKGKGKDKLHQQDDQTLEKLTGTESSNNAKEQLCIGNVSTMRLPQTELRKVKKKNKPHETAECSLKSKQIVAKTTDDTEAPTTHEVDHKQILNCTETTTYPELAESEKKTQVCDTTPCSSGRKSSKCSRAKGGSKCRSKISESSRKKNKPSKRKNNKKKAGGRHEKVGVDIVLSKVESHPETGNHNRTIPGDIEEQSNDSNAPLNSMKFSSDGVVEQQNHSKYGWVLCDECAKWRRIPGALANKIEPDHRWTCKENADSNFADCSIPQEITDEEINRELGISEPSEEDPDGTLKTENQTKVTQPSSWSLIKSNLFLHRSRKRQTIDEVMVCHCKPPADGGMSCGAECLNRMLNIECVQGTCPCGELCSNQQFQKRNYAKLKWFKCGKKGYGLQALEDISNGQFLIEYVGEVLDVRAYEARQAEYALNGHKHFYFMTLNGSEVIDACAKGNLGRFINHSCDPNCRTEKWMVDGEVCIGLFSLRDIKKGEEITFDYNYVRVFGAAAKKCVCSSPNCRGYIGGDPTNSEVIVQDDSDDEFSEPVMVCEERDMNEEWNEIISSSLHDKENEITHEPTENEYNVENILGAVSESIPDPQTSDSVTEKVEGINITQAAGTPVRVCNSSGEGLVEPLESTKQNHDDSNDESVLANIKSKSEDLQPQMLSSYLVDSLQKSDTPEKELTSAHDLVDTVSPSKALTSTIVVSRRKVKYASMGGKDEPPKPNSISKTKRSTGSVKKGKPKAGATNDKGSPDTDRLTGTLHKSKKSPGLPITNHFEAVEAKLNELLDLDGGISKKKDSSRGYLKLLFLTAASGSNGHGEAIQSNRDLSMILDALLKTKSRSVLVDIINKNGLQMLHNILKRYRREFIKTPILRKLLKVLEHLALRHILTLEHITGGPPRPGVESFKDSILTLAEHADKQVHQIARSFRDRWIPRSLRKSCCIEMDIGRSEINQPSSHDLLPTANNNWSDRDRKPSEAINCGEKQLHSAPSTGETSTLDPSASGANGTKVRKRKSRWDHPAETPRISPKLTGNKQLSIDDDLPPGFSSPCNGRVVPSDTPSSAVHQEEIRMQKRKHPGNVVLGVPPPRFNARMPVSYGISRSLMQQFEVLQSESSNCCTIAPGVPFLPFPPLPPHPCGSRDRPASAVAKCASVSDPFKPEQQHDGALVEYQAAQKRPRTYTMDPPDDNPSAPNGQPNIQQGTSNGLGRKYFRQQKWNHSKMAPPWVRMRNNWGYAGSNALNNSSGAGLGNGTNGIRNLYSWQETNWRG
ncbi:histone-lysine N-methyltransferase ASHH2 isoform X2 [Andrographis paniculata]|nr:histone-lysine N-methyltransferase ASHH2 isoform X2 [Andrographis paniculata]